MKAIILASGTGKRLRPLTDSVPKPLLMVGHQTILDYQLRSFIKHGISDVVITTGPFREQLEEHVRSRYSADVQFIHNPRFETTNYIYTLWLTKEAIDDDIVLVHGDLLFEDAVTSRLLESTGNRVLLSREIPPPEKDFKAAVEGQRVVRIGVDVRSPNIYFCAPMYKFSKRDFLRWLDKMEEFLRQGKVDCYAEDALNEITDEVMLQPLYFTEFCMEIDTMADLEEARRWVVGGGEE